jgi:predicted MFS family arabinose efflux permease
MVEHDEVKALERNVRLYPWYVALFNAFFWMPIFFLYFSAHLPLSRVLQLEGIYYAGVVILEVPSGYFSDRVGRRTSLLISATLLVAAYALFFLSDGFAEFALAQVLLAGGIAFNSGTGTAFHYDSLVAIGREEEYADREAIVARNALAATGLAALAGGVVGSFQLDYAYALSATAGLGVLGLALAFHEPEHTATDRAARFGRQLVNCLAHLKTPALAWLFGFGMLAVVINHIPYEFYQPYLDTLGARVGFGEHTALAAGAHMAVATLIGAWVARRSALIDARLGTGQTLLLAGVIQLVIIAAMASVLHVAVVALILLRGVPGGIYKAPLNAAVTPRIPQQERATYLSIQSLAGRLGLSGLLGGLSLVAAGTEIGRWPVLSELLMICAAVGAAGLLVLVVSLRGVDLET